MKESIVEKIKYLYYYTPAGTIFLILCAIIPLTGSIIMSIILLILISWHVTYSINLNAFISVLVIASVIAFISFVLYDNYSVEFSYSKPQDAKIKSFTEDESHIVLDINGNDKLVTVSKAEFYKLQSRCKPMYKVEYAKHYYGDTTSQIVVDCIK